MVSNTCSGITNSSRPHHTTIAKEDKMLEVKQREESVNQAQEVRADDSYVTLGGDDTDVAQTADDVYEEIYVSKLWRNVDESKVL